MQFSLENTPPLIREQDGNSVHRSEGSEEAPSWDTLDMGRIRSRSGTARRSPLKKCAPKGLCVVETALR